MPLEGILLGLRDFGLAGLLLFAMQIPHIAPIRGIDLFILGGGGGFLSN